jgi:ribosomal protein S12 methylthiotransferase accessory factor YcaO
LKAFRRAAQFAHGFRPRGKGLDLAQETASVLMEAIEGFQAEEVGEGGGPPIRSLSQTAVLLTP